MAWSAKTTESASRGSDWCPIRNGLCPTTASVLSKPSSVRVTGAMVKSGGVLSTSSTLRLACTRSPSLSRYSRAKGRLRLSWP
ncbi:hypothetical protein D3C76_1092240 [compost metagenome]